MPFCNILNIFGHYTTGEVFVILYCFTYKQDYVIFFMLRDKFVYVQLSGQQNY